MNLENKIEQIYYFFAINDYYEYNYEIDLNKWKKIDPLHTEYMFEIVQIDKYKYLIKKIIYYNKIKYELDIIPNKSIIEIVGGMIGYEIYTSTFNHNHNHNQNDIIMGFLQYRITKKEDIIFYSEEIEKSINDYLLKINNHNNLNIDYNFDYNFDKDIIIKNINIINANLNNI